MRLLILHPKGTDRAGRPVFEDKAGKAYVDIDYQINPRREILTKYPAFATYAGEPDCRLADDICVVFADGPLDSLVEEVNELLEWQGKNQRFILTADRRIYLNNDVDDGDEFDEIPPKYAATYLEKEYFKLTNQLQNNKQ